MIKIGKLSVGLASKRLAAIGLAPRCLAYFLVLILGFQAQAATQVDGLIDRNTVAVWEQFVFTVSVTSTESVSAEEPTIPAIDGARVVNMSTGSSTSTKMIQGPGGWQFDTVRKTDYSFVMAAQKTGTITIPAVSVSVDGKAYQTKPVRVTVVNQGQAPQQQPQMNQPGGGLADMDALLDDPDELFRQLMQRRMGGQLPGAGRGGQPGGQFGTGGGVPGNGEVVPKNPNELFFIHTDVDKRQAYEGEQITVNWSIYVKGNLIALDRTKFPDLKGFWKEIIEEVPALQFTQEVINGQVYRKALLASHALFPIKEGTATIDEYKIKGQVQSLGNAFGIGGGQVYSVNRASERVVIKVLPLPKENRPGDFSGAVGDFNVQATIDNNVVNAHQPFTLKIRFEGAGNAKLIEMPTVNWPGGLEMYETKQDSKFFKNGQSYKQFDVLLIPRQEGDMTLPPITVSLFDPKTAKYYTRTTEPIQIKVLPGTAPDKLAAKPVTTHKKEEPQGPTLPAPVLEKAGVASFYGGSTFSWGLVGFSYLGIFGFLGFRGFKDLWTGKKSKDLQGILKKGLAKSRALAKQGDSRQTGITMINLLDEILGGISGKQGVDQEVRKALDQIPPSLRRSAGPDLLKWMEVFQTIAFAPDEVIKDYKNPVKLNEQIDGAEKTLNQVMKLSQKTDES